MWEDMGVCKPWCCKPECWGAVGVVRWGPEAGPSRRRECESCTTWLVRDWLAGWYSRPPMLCTNKGYKRSVIFSLLAKSRARSNGILKRNDQF